MRRDAHYDEGRKIEDGAQPFTATRTGKVDGNEATLDTGKGQLAIGAAIRMIVSGLSTANGDETYVAEVLGSNDLFAANSVSLGSIPITSNGTWDLYFTNVQAGVLYRSFRLKVSNGGTNPSVTMLAYQVQFGV